MFASERLRFWGTLDLGVVLVVFGGRLLESIESLVVLVPSVELVVGRRDLAPPVLQVAVWGG